MRKMWPLLICLALLATLVLQPTTGVAQSPVLWCNSTSPAPPWCSAVGGDRPSAWIPQGRSEVMSRNGIVSTSQPLAAQAGLRILQAGGNAIDAAVATAAALNVMEPMNVGVGGDLFAIFYIAKEKKLYQLNAGGMAPTGATVAYYNSLGRFYDPNDWSFGSGMPGSGILSAPVPSAAWGWDEAVKRFGKLSLMEDLTPAIEYAEKGFPVSEIIGSRASGWSVPNAVNSSGITPCGRTLPSAAPCNARDPDSVAVWMPFAPYPGKGPAGGQIFKNPDLAHTLRLFGEQGRDVFYKGEIAHAIVAKSQALGGTMTLEDLRNYYGEWVEAPHTNYHGYEIYEAMAPSQAWNVLELMNILEVCVPGWIETARGVSGKTLAYLGPTDPLYWHLFVEAKKLSFIDLYSYNSDPRTWTPPSKMSMTLFNTLISKDHANSLCSKVNPNGPALKPSPIDPPTGTGVTEKVEGDTIYLTTADRWGNMVSWVNSNYSGFGSGITIPGYGFVLNNRMAQFTLWPDHPNDIAPHKRPYDTISAGFVMKDGKPLMTLGLMGGDMQVQGHAQMLVNILDLGANLQASTDMARFYHDEVDTTSSHDPTGTLSLERDLYNLVPPGYSQKMADILKGLGHHMSSSAGASVGGYQAIMFTPDPNEPAPDLDDHGQGNAWGNVGKDLLTGGEPSINGFYRAGSDHRKDGEAVGW